jgi:hypothetical protein
VGQECLPVVVQEAPPLSPATSPISSRGDLLAGSGFLAVLVLSIFPWSNGAFSGFFGAWSGHWSLVAVSAGIGGVAAAAVALRESSHPALAVVAYAVLALSVGTAAALFRLDPPVLSEPSLPSGLALVASGASLAGAALKWRDLARARLRSS